MADLSIANHGSVMVLTGLSKQGRDWMAEKVGNEESMCWGKHGIVVEPRYMGPIIEGAVEDGLEIAA